ncbi:MAG: RNA polymerase factor sigma-54 [Syntrophomonadaceae bacterium]|nr:RNA polymerase factor sigma-54 [Syntrophomonadaceae bacterium]
MRLTNDIFLEQQQKLVMTPELRLAIAILQMSTMELEEYAQQELNENPLLDVQEPEEPSGDSAAENAEAGSNGDLEPTTSMEEWADYYHDRDIGYSAGDREDKSYDNFLTKRPTLYEHLQFQLRLVCKEIEDEEVGLYIIGNIDDNGYLCVSREEMAFQTGASPERVDRVLGLVQSFHPHGVGAFTLQESLMIQLRYFGKEDSLAEKIIYEHLDDLAQGRLAKISQAVGISVQQVQGVCDIIRTLDPKPGLQYSSDDEIKYIIPDAIVEKIEGQYVVVLNDNASPRLVVNRLYKSMMRKPGQFSDEARKYLGDKMNSAIWLIRSIEQRRRTLDKVIRCIVDIQTDFLDQGIKYLKPLTLKQVADLIEVHESTVSRATSKKYIQTPQGLFELKFFFGSGISTSVGTDKVSAKSIKRMLEEIITGEDPARPISDQAIVAKLQDEGIDISRRTVAKYRGEMGIPATSARKRY